MKEDCKNKMIDKSRYSVVNINENQLNEEEMKEKGCIFVPYICIEHKKESSKQYMEDKIKQLIQQYSKGGFTQSEIECELLNLYAVSMRSELLSAFSWISLIGEQFFDSSKTVDDMIYAYQKSR